MEFLNNIFTYKNTSVVQGLTEELSVQYMFNKYKENDDNLLIVTSSMYEANKYFQLLRTYTDEVYIFTTLIL